MSGQDYINKEEFKIKNPNRALPENNNNNNIDKKTVIDNNNNPSNTPQGNKRIDGLKDKWNPNAPDPRIIEKSSFFNILKSLMLFLIPNKTEDYIIILFIIIIICILLLIKIRR